eukprot:Clim_evm14s161 gene=Clim_evmTU14s161
MSAAEAAAGSMQSVADLNDLQSALDDAIADVTDRQKKGDEGRKALVGLFKRFRAETPDEERKKVGPLIRAFQTETDSLTRRCRVAEAMIVDIYDAILRVNDGKVGQSVLGKDESPQHKSNEDPMAKTVVLSAEDHAALQTQIDTATKGLAEARRQLGEVTADRDKAKGALAQFKAEVAEIRNQDGVIQRLQRELAAERQVTQNRSKEIEAEKTRDLQTALEDYNQSTAATLDELRAQLRAEEARSRQLQDQLDAIRGGGIGAAVIDGSAAEIGNGSDLKDAVGVTVDVRVTQALQEQIKACQAEINDLNAELDSVTRERESLRLENESLTADLDAAKVGSAPGTVSAGGAFGSVAGGYDAGAEMDELAASLGEELASVRRQCEDLSAELSVTRSQRDALQTEATTAAKALESDRQRHAREQDLWSRTEADLRTAIANRDNRLRQVADYDTLREELHALKIVEFGDDYERLKGHDGAFPDGQNRDDSTNPEQSPTLNTLLVTKNRKLESSLVALRQEVDTLRGGNAELTQSLMLAREAERKSRTTVETLEQDIERLRSAGMPPSIGQQSPTAPIDPGRGAASDPLTQHLQSSLTSSSAPTEQHGRTMVTDGHIPNDGQQQQSQQSQPQTDMNDQQSMVGILKGQRDRLREANEELVARNQKIEQQLRAAQQQVKDLDRDNLQLYERTRFLESYKGGNEGQGQASRGSVSVKVDNDRYEQTYRQTLDPFKEFKRQERQRQFDRLNAIDKAILLGGQTIVSTKTTRTVFFTYTVVLHALVFFTIMRLSATAPDTGIGGEQCAQYLAQHMSEVHGAAGDGN